jgi:hypothetical protein
MAAGPSAVTIDPSDVVVAPPHAAGGINPADVEVHGQGKSGEGALSRFASNFWDQVNPLAMGNAIVDMAKKAVTHPVDAVLDTGEALAKPLRAGLEALHKGDPVEAARHFVNYGLSPVGGGTLDAAGDQMQQGDIAGGLGKTAGLGTAMVVAPKLMTGAAETIHGIPDAVNAVKQFATKPGTPKILGGAGEMAAGAGAMVTGHPVAMVYGAGGAARGMSRLMKGLAENKAAAAAKAVEAPPIFDDLAQSLGGKSFDKLSPEGQATVRNIAGKIANPEASAPVPKTVADLANPEPKVVGAAEPVSAERPDWRQGIVDELQPKGATVEDLAKPQEPKPESGTIVPMQGKPPKVGKNTAVAEEVSDAPGHPREAVNRDRLALDMAQKMHESGISAEDMRNATPEHWTMARDAVRLYDENGRQIAGKKSTAPSPATVKAALQHLERLGKTRAIAQQLADEVNK